LISDLNIKLMWCSFIYWQSLPNFWNQQIVITVVARLTGGRTSSRLYVSAISCLWRFDQCDNESSHR
jgi:hypothetical protein